MNPQEQPSNQPVPPSQAPANTPPQKSKGYGKRPKWQWILLYVIVAIIIYGLIYVLFIHKSGSTSTGSSSVY
jgi:hypothetical protein